MDNQLKLSAGHLLRRNWWRGENETRDVVYARIAI